MSKTWTPSTGPDQIAPEFTTRVQGWRAIIEFTPKPTSQERLCAGVVTRSATGDVQYLCALDARKMAHAFGSAGAALHDVAVKLCQSLAEHWSRGLDPQSWAPPFSNARLAYLDKFSARDVAEASERILKRTSTLHTLLAEYEMEIQTKATGIVEKVRSAVRRDANAKHLAKCFNRQLMVAGEAQPLKVDFLGQHYACYFLQVTRSLRGIEATTERAFGKLFELEALRKMVKKPKKTLGLLDEERPESFELLMVGDRHDAVQRKAIYQVEALADRKEVLARVETTASAAAERVSQKERRVA